MGCQPCSLIGSLPNSQRNGLCASMEHAMRVAATLRTVRTLVEFFKTPDQRRNEPARTVTRVCDMPIHQKLIGVAQLPPNKCQHVPFVVRHALNPIARSASSTDRTI